LTASFKDKWEVLGVLYLHSVHDPRMKGSGLKNLRLFEKIAGKRNLHKCRLVTTKWSLQSIEIGEGRELELKNNPKFWKQLLRGGARMVRFGDSMKSALDIINQVAQGSGVVLQLTDERQNKQIPLVKTEAGKEVDDSLERAHENHQNEVAELTEQYDDFIREKDLEMARITKEERDKYESKLEEIERDRRILREQTESQGSGRIRRWIFRGAAATAGAIMTVASGGLLAPAAMGLMGATEAVVQVQKRL